MDSIPVIEIKPISEYNLSTDGECTINEFDNNGARGLKKGVYVRLDSSNRQAGEELSTVL